MTRLRGSLLPLLLAAAIAAGACSPGPAPSAANVTADFDRAVNLYPGARVRVSGVDVGRVKDVTPTTDGAVVSFWIEGTTVPADSSATILPLSVLGERYIQLIPGTSETALADGDVIPRDRTFRPRDLDDLLEGAQDFIEAVDVDRAAAFVRSLAETLEGNGEHLGQMIGEVDATLRLINESSDDLHGTVEAVADVLETLDARDATLRRFLTDYGRLAESLAANRELVGESVTTVADALETLTALVSRNATTIEHAASTGATTVRTAAANMDAVEGLLAELGRLFEGVHRAYDHETNQLRTSMSADDAETAANVTAARVVDRMRGICRRLTEAGSSDPVLDACTDATSAFFDGFRDVFGPLLVAADGDLEVMRAFVAALHASGIEIPSSVVAEANAPLAGEHKLGGLLPPREAGDREDVADGEPIDILALLMRGGAR